MSPGDGKARGEAGQADTIDSELGNAATHEENNTVTAPGQGEGSLSLIPDLLARYAENSVMAFKFRVPRKCSDTGNAERLYDAFGGQLLYDATRRTWRWWDGRRFAMDETGIARCCARAVVRALGAEASRVEDEDERKRIHKWAVKADDTHRIDALLKEASSLPGFAVTTDVFDRDPWLLSVDNGTLNLHSGAIQPHDPADRITRLVPLTFDADACCPLFLKALDEMMLGREELVTFLQRFLGYSLTGITREQVFVIAHGAGANGKSTLLNAVAPIFGDYAATTPAETFVAKSRPSIPNDVAALARIRFLRCSESESNAPLAESLVKSATGGEPLSARFLHGEYFSFVPEFKLLLSTNHRPRIRGTDHAIWRRILLLPFDAVFDGQRRDDALAEKLHGELPGILAWAVRGCIDWQERGLGIPDIVRAVTAEYRHEEDRLSGFMDDRVTVQDGLLARGGELYAEYRVWAEKSGEKTMSGKVFGLALLERGFTRERTKAGAIWRGLGLKGESDGR